MPEREDRNSAGAASSPDGFLVWGTRQNILLDLGKGVECAGMLLYFQYGFVESG